MLDSNFANPNRTRIAYLRAVWIFLKIAEWKFVICLINNELC